MVLGGVIIMVTWPENYGDNSEHSLYTQFKAATTAIIKGGFCLVPADDQGCTLFYNNALSLATSDVSLCLSDTVLVDEKVALLGAMQSMFEAAM